MQDTAVIFGRSIGNTQMYYDDLNCTIHIICFMFVFFYFYYYIIPHI